MRLYAIGICLVLASSAGAASLGDLAWMAGHWRTENDGSSIEELWTKPAGSVMLGLNRSVRSGANATFEFLRIEERDGTIAFIAQPGGAPPTAFPLASIEGTKVVFENPDHDFPQRIIYWMDGDRLCARAESISEPGEGPQWCWGKAPDLPQPE